jgi:hypothetical protein
MTEQTQKWFMIGVGAAAIATACYMIFRTGQAIKKEKEEEEQVVERVNFVDPTLSQAELDVRITKWVNEQVSALLRANPNNVLQTHNFALSHEDFLDVTNIAQNYVRVKQFTNRQQRQSERLDLIKKEGYGSGAYLARLIDD